MDTGNLSSLPAGIFSGLNNLETIHLSFNNLSSLPAGIFSGLNNLELLYLHNNNLSSLPEGIFSGLNNLQELTLRNNNLSSLPAGIFSGLNNLERLSLHTNNLSSLPAGIFSGLNNLERLYLYNNNLSCLPTLPSSLQDLYVYSASDNDINDHGLPTCGADPEEEPMEDPEEEPMEEEEETCGENPNQERCNRPPIVTNRHFSITRQVRLDVLRRALLDFNLDNHFRDPDGDALSYTATSSHPDIVRTLVKGNTLNIAAIGRATFRIITITVTADDGKGGTVSTEFGVTVRNLEASDEAEEFLQETVIEVAKELATSIGPGKALKVVGAGAKILKSLDVAGSVKSIKEGIEAILDANEQNSNQQNSNQQNSNQQNSNQQNSNQQSSNQQLNSLAEALYIHHGALQNGSLSLDQAFAGHTFSIPLRLSKTMPHDQEDSASPPFNALLKGSLDFSSFSDTTTHLHYDGTATSYGLGIDLFPNPDAPLLTGLQLAFTRSHSDFEDQQADTEGTYELNMFSLHPFVAWDATDTLTLWSALGYGWPEAETTIAAIDGSDVDSPEDASHTSSGQFLSIAGGANYRVWQSDASALTLKLGGGSSSFLDNNSQQGHVATQFSHAFTLNAGQLNSSADLALLLSDSDATATELSGNLNWLPNQGRLLASTNARVLLFGGDRSEWGIGGSVLLRPGQQGQGLSLSLQPSFGQTNASLSHLHLDPFSFSDPNELALSSSPLTARFNAELAYGFPTANHALLTPYIDASLAHSSNTYTTGLRYQLDSDLNLDLSASHRQRSSGNNDNRFFLQLRSDL